MATASFDGVSFDAMADPLSWTKSADVNVRHIPGGNISYVDLGGIVARTINLTIYITAANLVTLLGKVGASGSLVYIEETVTAILQNISRQERQIAADSGTTMYVLSASFITQ